MRLVVPEGGAELVGVTPVVKIGSGAEVQVRLWSERDLAAIRKFMRENAHGNRGPRKSLK